MQTHLYDTRDVHLLYTAARQLPSQTVKLWMDKLRQLTTKTRVRRIVDLGCGTGRFTQALADRFDAEVVAIDLSAKMLGVAREQVGSARVYFVQASAEAIPLADASVDLVFMSMVYHHLTDRAAAFLGIRSVLAPGGCCAVRTCSMENLDSYVYQRFFPEARQVDLQRLEPRQRTIDQIKASGLDLIAQETVRQITANSMPEYLRKIEQRGTSDLEAISDTAFAAGMGRFREFANRQPTGYPICEELDLLMFARRT